MQTWENGSKSKLPAGPWTSEPDKAQWVDAYSGYDCLMVRNGLGALCGYVGVPPGHPWYGLGYDEVDADVHGGLTFADRCHESADPAQGICHVPLAGRPADVWWLGFDCAHYRDLVPGMMSTDLPAHLRASYMEREDQQYRSLEYVQQECRGLAAQAKAAER